MVLQETWQYLIRYGNEAFERHADKGPCACGGAHVAVEIKAGRDLPGIGTDRTEWRYCSRCYEVYFVGYPEAHP